MLLQILQLLESLAECRRFCSLLDAMDVNHAACWRPCSFVRIRGLLEHMQPDVGHAGASKSMTMPFAKEETGV
jgi:hypothetical protein